MKTRIYAAPAVKGLMADLAVMLHRVKSRVIKCCWPCGFFYSSTLYVKKRMVQDYNPMLSDIGLYIARWGLHFEIKIPNPLVLSTNTSHRLQT